MADYLVVFVDTMRRQGPVEVYRARVLPNGWVEVQSRKISKSVNVYPPQMIVRFKTPRLVLDAEPSEETEEDVDTPEPDSEEDIVTT